MMQPDRFVAAIARNTSFASKDFFMIPPLSFGAGGNF
jgi:hypothetical protein